MKKFKNLMLMLALALFFVGAMGVTKASAADDTPTTTPTPSVTKIASDKATVVYANEWVKVECDDQVYYQVVKSATPGTLKAANWIKAAKGEGGYYIDFSGIANGKDGFIALTANNAATEADVVATIDAVVKSIKVTLNYKAEKVTNGLADIITTLNVKSVDGTADNEDGTVAEYNVVWKRGANGNWNDESEKKFSQLEWDMLKASNGTLYVAIDGSVADEKTTDFRMSKEAKVKIPKAAKAPNVKVDFTKGTVALKNGMQVRQAGKNDWVTVLPLTKDAEVKETKIFGTDAEATKTKVSSVAVSDLLAQLKDNGVKDGEEISIEVRTAATDKKFPSAIGTISFKTPAAATSCTEATIGYVKADKNAKIAAEFTIDFTKILTNVEEYDAYEYILVDSAEAKVDFAKQKWTKIPANGLVDLKGKIEAKTKYTEVGGTTKEFEFVKTTNILVRKAADKANSLFPSAYAAPKVTITETKVFAITTTKPEGVTKISYKVGEGTALKAKKGEKVTLTIELEEGYTIEKVMAGDTEVTATNSVYSFDMPEKDVAITVTVKAPAASGGEQGGGETGDQGTT